MQEPIKKSTCNFEPFVTVATTTFLSRTGEYPVAGDQNIRFVTNIFSPNALIGAGRAVYDDQNRLN